MDEDPREEKNRPTLVESIKKVQLDGPGKVVQIGATLPDDQDGALILLLDEFKKLFAWKPSDMSGIRKDVISHELKVDLSKSFKSDTHEGEKSSRYQAKGRKVG